MNMDKENKEKESFNDEREDRQNSKTLKTVFFTVIITLLVIAILLLCILFGLKNCSGNKNNNEQTSSEIVKDEELNNRFLNIVKKQAKADSFDDDDINNIVAVMYEDKYPTSFTVHITARSDTKVYFYIADNVKYPENKEGYDNFVTYLRNDKSELYEGDDVIVSTEDVTKLEVNTNKKGKWVTSISPSSENHLSGYYLENNEFHIYQRRLLNDNEDPFIAGVGDQIIKNGDLLYNYYLGLNL